MKKIAVINIIYENSVSIEAINDIFHEFRDYVIGRHENILSWYATIEN